MIIKGKKKRQRNESGRREKYRINAKMYLKAINCTAF